MIEKLIPCPFCGREARLQLTDEEGHFKNINGDELIKDILANCEVVKNAES